MGKPSRLSYTKLFEDFLDHARREAKRRLIEQQQLRVRHQGAADGEHLLLAAGERAGDLTEPLLQAREQ